MSSKLREPGSSRGRLAEKGSPRGLRQVTMATELKKDCEAKLFSESQCYVLKPCRASMLRTLRVVRPMATAHVDRLLGIESSRFLL
ncbi:unnamed protein product [Sphagnum balticum]